MVAVPAGDLQRVRLDAYREIVVNDTALPHTFDGDGGLTRHFGEPDGVCYIVVGDAVPAVEVGFGMWGNDGLFARPVDFGQSLLSNLLKTVQRVSQYDAVVVIDITSAIPNRGSLNRSLDIFRRPVRYSCGSNSRSGIGYCQRQSDGRVPGATRDAQGYAVEPILFQKNCRTR